MNSKTCSPYMLHTRAVGGSENPWVPGNINVVGVIYPLVDIGLTDLPKFWGAMAPPEPPKRTTLIVIQSKIAKTQMISL